MVEQLTASVLQIQRDRHQVGGNGVSPAQPNQPVLERPPNYHRNDPRDPIINVEAPTFDGRLDPKVFTDWIREMDHFFECKPSFGRRFESRNTPRPPATLPPSRPVPNTAPLLRDGKEKGILAESPGMKFTLQCYKCQEQLYEPDLENFPESDEDCEGGDVTLGVVRCALTQAKEDNDWRRNAIFYTYIKCGEKDCKVIIDSGSCINAVSSSTVSRLGLKPVSHPSHFDVPTNPFSEPTHEPSIDHPTTSDITPAPLPISPAPKEHIDAILDEQIISTRDGGVQRFLVRWSGRPASDDTWITSDDLQQIDRDLFEYYQSRPSDTLDGVEFSSP
ncbi:hypothetical protein Acr_23g0011620 [Actinidia rufa]|uniref:Chromo domain-containing protein n=1 Tax=Actinidia rufa TaxID=165716 RepID=A0A7J0GPN1_9ERIC|nr:hypothetical protein Acr_23g0011620 [Actinidia rufa]